MRLLDQGHNQRDGERPLAKVSAWRRQSSRVRPDSAKPGAPDASRSLPHKKSSHGFQTGLRGSTTTNTSGRSSEPKVEQTTWGRPSLKKSPATKAVRSSSSTKAALSQKPHRCRTWAPRGVLQFNFNWEKLSDAALAAASEHDFLKAVLILRPDRLPAHRSREEGFEGLHHPAAALSLISTCTANERVFSLLRGRNAHRSSRQYPRRTVG